ncbi:MAG: hypothetical protein ACQEWV_28385 [Bacillota bacterium]
MFSKRIDKVNIGALPFLPNATRLVEQFVEHLIEKSPEEIQREGILPRGTKEDWISALDDKVLVGIVSSEEDYPHIQHLFYQIPTSRLKKGWQEAKYIALYPKSGVVPQNGITVYGKINEVKVLKSNKGEEPTSNDSDEYVRFEIEVWKSLKEIVKPVGYGISVYTVTTLNTLKQAKELPEIFMKSKEEVTLWRMLRRISDRVQFDLDDLHLDKATRIESYRIKDLSIEMNTIQKTLLINKGSETMRLDFESLLKNPSYVFKEIVNYIH